MISLDHIYAKYNQTSLNQGMTEWYTFQPQVQLEYRLFFKTV